MVLLCFLNLLLFFFSSIYLNHLPLALSHSSTSLLDRMGLDIKFQPGIILLQLEQPFSSSLITPPHCRPRTSLLHVCKQAARQIIRTLFGLLVVSSMLCFVARKRPFQIRLCEFLQHLAPNFSKNLHHVERTRVRLPQPLLLSLQSSIIIINGLLEIRARPK